MDNEIIRPVTILEAMDFLGNAHDPSRTEAIKAALSDEKSDVYKAIMAIPLLCPQMSAEKRQAYAKKHGLESSDPKEANGRLYTLIHLDVVPKDVVDDGPASAKNA